MVTFSVPDFDYSTTSSASTPTNRSRSPSPVAKRSNAGPSSPKSSSSRRLGTPHPSSRRAPLTTLDEITPRRFTQSSTGAGSNIFGASAPAKNPFGATFTPRVLQSAMKKPFSAPRIRSTPGPSRVHFEPMPTDTPPRAISPPPEMATSRALSTPQALLLESKPMFTMRIPSPPPELTGEVLTDKIPKTWNAKGSIYADQFLAHLCPPELDEEQRRQYFCILDLRRLKYSANEIFLKKDWTLNIINFAKEFEKSRSLLMLRYGLYEFRKVKPSKDVLKRWRREHGLPDPEDEEDEEEEEVIPTPSKSRSKKRKATDDDDSLAPSSKKGKRRATEALVTEPTAFASTPTGKNKRKASGGEDSPSPAKIQKSTPSSSKSLFEKVVNKPAAATPAKSAIGAESSAFGSSSNSARNIFSSSTTSKNFGTPTTSGGNINIFSHISNTSAAKPSDNDEDADSESDPEQDDSQADDAAQDIQETSGAAEGVVQAGAQGSQADVEVNAGADAGEKEKAEAEPASPAGSHAKPFQAPAVADQTWNPTKTPIKFAPSASASTSSPFGNVGATPKASVSFGSFGASSQGASFTGGGSAKAAADQAVGKHGNQSDMDNDSPSAKKARFETKSPAGQSAFGSNPFASSQPASSASHVFGSSSFASASSPEAGPSAVSAPPPPSFLFGSKATETYQAPTSGASYSTTGTSTATSVFGGVGESKTAPDTSTADQTTSFDAKPSTSTASSLFGSGESTPAQQPQPVTAAADAPKLSFGFGSTGTTAAPSAASKPFGAPDTPADFAAAAATSAGMPPFGSSMKQFDFSTPAQSALKSSAIDDAPPKFNFGSGSSTIAASAPVTSSFGAPSSFGSQPTSSFGEESSKPKSTTQHVFGAASSFGGGESSQPKSPTKPVFGDSSSFGSGSSQPTSPPKHTFGASSFGDGSTRPGSSFGEESKKAAAPTKHIFGSTTPFGGASSQPAAPTGIFGASTSFGGAGSQPAWSTVNIFGGSSNTALGSNSLSFGFGKGTPTAAATTTTPSTSFSNPFSFASGGADAAAPAAVPSASSSFSFGGAPAAPSRPVSPFKFGSNVTNAPVFGSSAVFSSAPVTGADPAQPPSFSFSSMSEHSAAAEETSSVLGPRPVASVSNLQPLLGGSSTTGTDSSLHFPGGSSLGSTPVAGTPEASAQADSANDGQATGEDGEEEEQVNLVDAADENEEVLHEIRAKVLKFVTASDKSDDKDGAAATKVKSPWAVQGIGQLRLLQNKETKLVRLLLRTEPRGHVALNRALLPNLKYEAQDKYVRLATANEDGTGLETWMIQVKKRELAKELAEVMEKNKKCNETA